LLYTKASVHVCRQIIMNDTIILVLLTVLITYIAFRVNRVESYDDPKIRDIRQKLLALDPRLAEISIQASNQSFTEDKKRMYLCLKDEQGQYYDDNMLMYVAAHEAAHAISQSVDPDHVTEEFRNNFKILLARAADKGFYDPNKPIEYNYCPKTPAITKSNSAQ
jgi:hypothetical protein